MKLHQVIALVSGKKNRAKQVLDETYKLIQKTDLFFGLSRTYTPKDDDPNNPTGEQLPPEYKRVQNKIPVLLTKNGQLRTSLAEMFDIVITQDVGNQSAYGDVVVNGQTILENVPAITLIFLEKQLTDFVTFIEKLPVMDADDSWSYDSDASVYRTNHTESVRTKKIPRAFVKYEATKEHPAQVEVVNDDIIVGTWRSHKLSGAISSRLRDEYLNKARALKEAVILAREKANSVEVSERSVGNEVLDFIFGNNTA